MITNATILRLDVPSGADSGGDETWTEGGNLSIRCQAISNPTEAYSKERVEELGNTTITVMKNDWASGLALGGYDYVAPAPSQRITVAYDDEATVLYRITQATMTLGAGALSSWSMTAKTE